MKNLLIGGLLVAGITSSIAQADVFASEDDSYLGFQITTSLDSKNRGSHWGASHYRYRILQRQNGIDSGIEISIDSLGRRSLNFVGPASGVEQGSLEGDYLVLPVLRLDAHTDNDNGTDDGAASSAYAGIARLVLLAFFAKMLENQLEKPFTPAVP